MGMVVLQLAQLKKALIVQKVLNFRQVFAWIARILLHL